MELIRSLAEVAHHFDSLVNYCRVCLNREKNNIQDEKYLEIKDIFRTVLAAAQLHLVFY